MSSRRSTSSMGARCGRTFLICSASSFASSLMLLLFVIRLALLGQPRQSVNLAGPFLYRFRRRTAIILPAFQEDARTGSRARAHAGAGADAAVIPQPNLPRQHH